MLSSDEPVQYLDGWPLKLQLVLQVTWVLYARLSKTLLTIIFGTVHGVIVSKLGLQTIVSKFDLHWVSYAANDLIFLYYLM